MDMLRDESSTLRIVLRARLQAIREDEPALSDMLIEFLTRHGFRVLVAPDGVLALRIFREKWQTIDLVLSDVGLPGLDGMGVFRGLREIDPNAACVLASGYLDPELQSKMRHEGILGFVQKPYELHNLERVLREALAVHGRRTVR